MRTIICDENLAREIQASGIEVEARKGIIAFMLSSGMDTNTEQFERYQKEYVEFYAKHEILKRKLEELYVIPETAGAPASWSLDYSNYVITISEVTENASV